MNLTLILLICMIWAFASGFMACRSMHFSKLLKIARKMREDLEATASGDQGQSNEFHTGALWALEEFMK